MRSLFQSLRQWLAAPVLLSNERLLTLQAELAEQAAALRRQGEGLERRIDRLQDTLDALPGRFDALQNRADQVQRGVDALPTRFDALQSQFEILDAIGGFAALTSSAAGETDRYGTDAEALKMRPHDRASDA